MFFMYSAVRNAHRGIRVEEGRSIAFVAHVRAGEIAFRNLL